ncbi:MAG TPA: hypothetical protein PLN21_18295 [Gemmatales bacterium]|nr:hypothetical protein [Gemmatales bacterium]
MTDSRWRAPREDGATLVVPTWQHLPQLIAENQRSLAQSPLRWKDRTLADVRQLASDGLNTQLSQWAGELGWTSSPIKRPLIVTGHQPELFHPGVWAKNVAISKLANELKGSSYNINVDSDVAKSTALKIPTIDSEGYDETFRFSDANPPLPYEEWQCENEANFSQLPDLIQPVVQTWPWQPVLPSFWQSAIEAQRFTKNLPERWIIARRAWENAHGITNHELTMSRWCRTEFFGWLVNQFVAEHARFASIYNEELHAYRKEHRIRSVNHPVADLLVSGDLVELPFWVWQTGTTQRGRLCARQLNGNTQLVALIAGKETLITQDSALSTQHFSAWKIRPKALITSMMFRLFLADLFVHGIGGAIYDELTDRIFARFWNVKLPRFAIVTATLRLPWHRQPVTEDDPRQLRQTLRALQWNPDRFLTSSTDSDALDLKKQKQHLMATTGELERLSERHHQYELIRTQLAPYVANEQHRIDETLVQTLQQLKRDEHHFSREHPWVLYPEQDLTTLSQSFSSSSGS